MYNYMHSSEQQDKKGEKPSCKIYPHDHLFYKKNYYMIDEARKKRCTLNKFFKRFQFDVKTYKDNCKTQLDNKK